MGYPDPYRFETWAGTASLAAPGIAGGEVGSPMLVTAHGVVPELWGLTLSATRGVDGLGGAVIVRWEILSGAGNAMASVYPPNLPLAEGDRVTLPWLAPSQHWQIQAVATFPPAFVGAIVAVSACVAPLLRPMPSDYAAQPYVVRDPRRV